MIKKILQKRTGKIKICEIFQLMNFLNIKRIL